MATVEQQSRLSAELSLIRTPILLVPEIAHQMGLVPLLCLAVLYLRGVNRDVGWWWIAGAFGVSWLADSATHWVAPWVISAVYPVSQAAIIGAVFLPRAKAWMLLFLLVAIALVALGWEGATGPDLLLPTIVGGTVAVIVLPQKALGWLRWSLLVGFTGTAIVWWAYAEWPGWTTWALYQSLRAVATVLFGIAALKPGPHLSLVRTA